MVLTRALPLPPKDLIEVWWQALLQDTFPTPTPTMPEAPKTTPVFGKTDAGIVRPAAQSVFGTAPTMKFGVVTPAVQSLFGTAPTMKFGVVSDKDVGAPAR